MNFIAFCHLIFYSFTFFIMISTHFNNNLHILLFSKSDLSHLPSFVNDDFDWNAPCIDVIANIVNIVGIAKFPHTFELKLFTLHWNNAVYEPKKIPCARIPLAFKGINAVALVYHSGNVVITGINDFQLAIKAFRTIALFYYQWNHTNSFPLFNFLITNVVATADIKQKINLLSLPALNNKIKFDPENFPAAIILSHDFIKHKATVLVYSNGKLVIAGVKKIFIAHLIAQFTIRELLPSFGIFVDRFNLYF